MKEAKYNVRAIVPKAEAKGECDSYEYIICTTHAGDHSFLDKASEHQDTVILMQQQDASDTETKSMEDSTSNHMPAPATYLLSSFVFASSVAERWTTFRTSLHEGLLQWLGLARHSSRTKRPPV